MLSVKGNMYTLSKIFLLPSNKQSTLKGKPLVPLRVDPFQKGLEVEVSKHGLQKLSPWSKLADILPNVSSPPRCLQSPYFYITSIIRPPQARTCLRGNADSEGPDQPAYPRSLIRLFAVNKQNHWISQNARMRLRMCRIM